MTEQDALAVLRGMVDDRGLSGKWAPAGLRFPQRQAIREAIRVLAALMQSDEERLAEIAARTQGTRLERDLAHLMTQTRRSLAEALLVAREHTSHPYIAQLERENAALREALQDVLADVLRNGPGNLMLYDHFPGQDFYGCVVSGASLNKARALLTAEETAAKKEGECG